MYVDGVGRRDRAELSERDRKSAGGGRNGDPRERFEARGLPGDQSQVELVIGLDEAGREDDVVAANRVDDLRSGNPPAGQPLRIEPDLELPPGSPLHLDLRHARNLVELRLEPEVRELPQLRKGARIGGQRIAENRKDRSVHPLGVEARLRGKIRTDAVDLGLDPGQGNLHVGAPRELRPELDGAPRRRGGHALDSRDAQKRLLQGARERRDHLGRGLLGRLRDDLDSREGHRGKDRRGQVLRRPEARGAEDREQQKQGAGALVEALREAHRRPPLKASERRGRPREGRRVPRR